MAIKANLIETKSHSVSGRSYKFSLPNVPIAGATTAETTEVTLPSVSAITPADYWTLNSPAAFYVWYTVATDGAAEVTEVTLPAASAIAPADYWTLDSPSTSFYVWYSETISIAIAEVTEVTLPAESAITVGDYWTLNDPTTSYYVYYEIDSSTGNDPAPGGTPILVDIATADTNAQVATKTAAAIALITDFNVPVPGAAIIEVTNVNAGAATDAAAGVGVTGISFTFTTQGADVGTPLGVDPAPGGTGIMVSIEDTDTAYLIADKTSTVIRRAGNFLCPRPNGGIDTIVVTNNAVGIATDAAAGVGVTGISFTVTTQGVDAGVIGADPAPGGTGIQVDLIPNDTSIEVADKTATALDVNAAFDSYVISDNILSVTNVTVGVATDAAAGVGVTGISFSVIQQGGVAGGNSVEFFLTGDSIHIDGRIHTIRMACASADYDISLMEKEGVVFPDTAEFYISTGNNQYILAYNQDVIWSNNDTPEKRGFYIVVTNNDTTATGTISLEIIM